MFTDSLALWLIALKLKVNTNKYSKTCAPSTQQWQIYFKIKTRWLKCFPVIQIRCHELTQKTKHNCFCVWTFLCALLGVAQSLCLGLCGRPCWQGRHEKMHNWQRNLHIFCPETRQKNSTQLSWHSSVQFQFTCRRILSCPTQPSLLIISIWM